MGAKGDFSTNYAGQPRDSQRSRLYEAEKVLEGLRVSVPARRLVDTETHSHQKIYPSFEDGKAALARGEVLMPKPLMYPHISACQAYVNDVASRAWFVNRWGERSLRVYANSGSNASHSTINLGAVHRRSEAVILHEMGHCLINPYREAWHGKEFAGIMLTLVRYTMGKEHADVLRESYKTNRVKHTLTGAQIQGSTKRAAKR